MRIRAVLFVLLAAVSLLANGTVAAMAGVKMQAMGHAAGLTEAAFAADAMPDCHARAATMAQDEKVPERAPPHAPDGCGPHCACACAWPQAAAFTIAWLPAASLRYEGPAPHRLASGHPQPPLAHPIRPPIG